jgi:hypothetical protein
MIHCFQSHKSNTFGHHQKLVDDDEKYAVGRSIPPDPRDCSSLPFTLFLQNNSFLVGLLVPLEKQSDDQDQYPDNPPAPILLIERGSCQREATGPDSEFGIVDGQRASGDKRKQQTIRSGLKAGRVGLGGFPSRLGLSQFSAARESPKAM